MNQQLTEIFARWRADESRQYRIMTFGASESHFCSHAHARPNWFHWLERSLRGDKIQFALINASQGGNCVRDLCGRFARDCAPLRPDLVFMTMGGNDANVPVPLDEFRERLTWLCEQVKAFGGVPVLQTLYWPVLSHFSPYYQEHLEDYMRINREVAAAEGTPCLDIARFFKPYYEHDPEGYARAVMVDDIHVNEVGNAVWGCLAAEEMGLPKPDLADMTEAVDEQLRIIHSLCS